MMYSNSSYYLAKFILFERVKLVLLYENEGEGDSDGIITITQKFLGGRHNHGKILPWTVTV